MNFGGDYEACQRYIELFLTLNHFGFLYMQHEKPLCALLGRYATLDWLSPTVSGYLEAYSNETPDRPILWCANLITHPDYQAMGLASRCMFRFSEYAEHYYRFTGVYLGCRIRQHNFASERSFAKAGFMPTGLFDEEDFANENFANYQFWIKIIPPLCSKEAEIFMSAEKWQELYTSPSPYYLP